MSLQMTVRATIAAAMTIAGSMMGARGRSVDDEETGGDAGIAMIMEMAVLADMQMERERRQGGGLEVQTPTRRCRRSMREASRRERYYWNKLVANGKVSHGAILI